MLSNTIWLAPAKLNLFLHVTGKRADGYHTLQTSFVFLDYYDQLSFSVNKNGNIARMDMEPEQALPEDDLCVQAAGLLQRQCSISEGVDIQLSKSIPMGAGLGGGSSDAATCLIALNQLWGCNLTRQDLAQIGVQLGADVPVFVLGQAAWAEGIGELLTPIFPEKKWICVIIPQIHVSTGQVFSDSTLTQTPPITKIRGSFSPGLRNDLEAVTCELYPLVKEAISWLSNFGNARMSGSGSSVFLACETRQEALAILNERPAHFDGFVAESLNKHPHLMIER